MSRFTKAMTIAVVLCLAMGTAAFGASEEKIAQAITGGQKYLMDQQAMNGSWSDNRQGDTFASTAFAVAALLETGIPWDDATVLAGINYLTSTVQSNVSGEYWWNDGWDSTYDNGSCLIALSLWVGAAPANAVPITVTQDILPGALDFHLSSQYRNPGSQYSGNWYYNTSPTTSGDNSNTQFGVMGAWYASRALGLNTNADGSNPWADEVYEWTQNIRMNDNTFAYRTTGGFTPGGPMTSAGLWILAMVGRDQDPSVQPAIDWFASPGVYSWAHTPGSYYGGGLNSYYYGVFGMAKALTATVSTQATIGYSPNERTWAPDLVNEMVDNKAAWSTNPADPASPTRVSWTGNGSLDGGNILGTAWVLMSMAFVDPNVEKPEALMSDPPEGPNDPPLDYPIRGLITLKSTGGVTISNASRRRIGPNVKATTVTLPVGAMEFQLNKVKPNGSCTWLTIKTPIGALDPTNANSFVNPDGTIKNINWFKIKGGEWKAEGAIPMVIDQQAGEIRVQLCDGGIGDEDGVKNGKIKDPGAPGFGTGAPAPPAPGPTDPTYESSDSFLGCFIDAMK